jgi:hypothetical protein
VLKRIKLSISDLFEPLHLLLSVNSNRSTIGAYSRDRVSEVGLWSSGRMVRTALIAFGVTALTLG